MTCFQFDYKQVKKYSLIVLKYNLMQVVWSIFLHIIALEHFDIIKKLSQLMITWIFPTLKINNKIKNQYDHQN